MNEHEATERILELMQTFNDAMLVTRIPGGDELRARPMRISQIEPDGTMWFVTSLASGKVPEINLHPQVSVTMQGGGRYLSLTGNAELVVSSEKLRELWQEPWKIWFPHGLETPELALIKVDVYQGEYWDYSGVAEKLKFLFEAGKAYFQNEAIDPDALANEKVELTSAAS